MELNGFERIPQWTPPSHGGDELKNFMKSVEDKYDVAFRGSYAKLHKWSCDNLSKFWGEVWKFCGIVSSAPFDCVVDESGKICDVPEWFPGARLNYAQNLLKRKDDKTALYFTGESVDGPSQRMSFKELNSAVQEYAASLRALGVKRNDRVAGYLPNCFQSVIAGLATASIGAVWSSASVDFGVMGVVERLRQVKPKVLFSVEAVIYNQKTHHHLNKLKDVVIEIPEIEYVIVIPFLNGKGSLDLSSIPISMEVEEFLKKGRSVDGGYPELVFEQVPFSHPLFIMFSSGTTGVPKCMVHSVGGTLIKHLAEHKLQQCMTEEDTIFFYTTVGWMMWNWLISSLALGASVVLYDGSPFKPKVEAMFDLVDELRISILGMGAKCYSLFEQKGITPRKTHDLSSLRVCLSTGSPLHARSYDYIYGNVKEDVLIGSISGGTDIIGCFLGATWLLPVHRGEIQVACLGCDVHCFDSKGNSVSGEKGDLVVMTPFPSMPTHFLNDPEGRRYRKSYFEKFPGFWCHGDFILVNPETRGILMLGRSDGTLNPGGVRFGSSEIYSVVESFPEIGDSICVGDGDDCVSLFLKMNPGQELDEALVARLKGAIRVSLSAKHVPKRITPVADIPYTVNGKKVEVAVRRILMGLPVENESAIQNPESLKSFTTSPNL